VVLTVAVDVAPVLDAAVTDPDEEFEAKLKVPSMAATEQSARAAKTRRLRRPDWEAGFFFIASSYLLDGRRMEDF